MIGKTIFHFKILEKIGTGGMGVVFKAEDTKLKRTVALKFLPPELTRDSEVKERFIREAQAASAFDHPNICTIHEINETEDGQLFISMAYYEGETLGNIIERGPLKIDEALDIALQIAQGLAKAHEQNIVHRDIKPANIIITNDGVAKIVDFGLAKLAGQIKLTIEGTTLGTIAFMSPEQARGEDVDQRTDIWSLGVVLYEMLAGQLPFKGEYEQAVIYSILNEEPEPLTALRTGVPLELERIVIKALVKDPAERYQHMDEIPVDLRAVKARPSSTSRVATKTTVASELPQRGRWRRTIPWVVAILMAIITGLLLWSPWDKGVPGSRTVKRFAINLPSSQPLWLHGLFQQPGLALSPDGTKLVYIVGHGGIQQLYLREMDQFDARPIPGTEDARNPFFSPDGEWVAFLTSSKLKKVSLISGTSVALCDVTPDVSSGGSWDPDDNIYFAPRPNSGLARVSANGGDPEIVTNPDSARGELGHWYPQVLPGGKALLFVVRKSGWSDTHIAALSLETGQWHTLTEGGTIPHYLSTGHLVYAQSGALLAGRFDLERLKVTGSPKRILEGIITRSGAEFTLSKDGSLVYIPGMGGWPKSTLFWVDRQGEAKALPLSSLTYSMPRLSPNGRLLAIEIVSQQMGNRDIWVCNLARNSTTRLTYNPVNVVHPVWTPDGKRITFASGSRLRAPQLAWKLADGSGAQEQFCERDYAQFPTSYSPDGWNMLFTDESPATRLDIWMLPMDDKSNPQPVVKTQFNETAAVFSPDGQWIAYQSDESRRYEVYVRPFRGPESKQQISSEGGTEPLWGPDGRELFYRNGDKMMVVTISTHPQFNATKPKLLFKGWYSANRIAANYDITPDGQRFIMIKGEQTAPTQIRIVLNWIEEVKRLIDE